MERRRSIGCRYGALEWDCLLKEVKDKVRSFSERYGGVDKNLSNRGAKVKEWYAFFCLREEKGFRIWDIYISAGVLQYRRR